MNAPDYTPPMLDPLEIEKVRKIAQEATTVRRRPLPQTRIEQRLDAFNKQVMSHAMLGFVTMISMALLAFYTKSQPLQSATLALGIIVQVFGLALLGLVIVGGLLFIWDLKKSPFGPFFTLVKSYADMDIEFAQRLAGCEKSAVQYVLTYYKYERANFEKRGYLIAGPVERIGMFPAMAALIVLVANLAKVSEVATWAVMFGPLIFAFYVMLVATFPMIQKMDRVIGLLEFSIQSRK